ncbi:SHOCT domain-containing protein [Ancylobacter pratisalsi]|uniref:SHOCT domain-containing protein n=2 Tax=Ancylobacter pratisalsi TaxID=1745854 RepID=A0A6P1YTQ1_9HYPH|nr:SHOCT domain-containing protein [Ancylobacter pratisalsi]QIB36260.1 SHOCT domain-containing protein [Ancylobacter pratisalsi]
MNETQSVKQRFIEDFAARHGLGTDAVDTLLRAVSAGGGTMAQFSHPELGGMGQWTRGGMIMVGDMFNQGLKYRVDTLCTEISDALMQNHALAAELRSHASGGQGYGMGAWWPEEFGNPSSSGAQNDLRYAFFPGARRLVVEKAGAQAIYDTGEHMISGVSQQQGGDQSLSFSSQFGVVQLTNLPRIEHAGHRESLSDSTPWKEQPTTDAPVLAQAPHPSPMPPSSPVPAAAPPRAPVASAPAASEPGARAVDDIFAVIERLADLRAKGILSEEEFAAKKAELLARL